MARSHRVEGPAETPYVLRYPPGWRKVQQRSLQKVDPPPALAIRRADHRGLVTLTVRGPLDGDLEELQRDFVSALSRRFADFELVTSRLLDVAGRPALYTSWTVREARRVHGTLLVPTEDHSYALDAVIHLGAPDVAREVGDILGSFALPA